MADCAGKYDIVGSGKRGMGQLCFDLPSGIERFHAKQEVENMCKPDDSKDDAGNPEAFSGHHEKPNPISSVTVLMIEILVDSIIPRPFTKDSRCF